MGACGSTSSKTHALNERNARIRTRVAESLGRIKNEIALSKESGKPSKHSFLSGNHISLDKIILKFDKCRPVIKLVRKVFQDIAERGGKKCLDMPGLRIAMQKLHGNMSDADIRSLFDFIDLDDSHEIDLKEFLVALVIGYILDVVPKNDDEGGNSTTDEEPTTTTDDTAASANDNSPQGPMPKLRKRDSLVSVNSLLAKQDELREMMTLIVTAHLLFDKNATGIIMRTDDNSTVENLVSNLKYSSEELMDKEYHNKLDGNIISIFTTTNMFVKNSDKNIFEINGGDHSFSNSSVEHSDTGDLFSFNNSKINCSTSNLLSNEGKTLSSFGLSNIDINSTKTLIK